MIGRIYVEHKTLLHTLYTSFGSCGLCIAQPIFTSREIACMDPRDTYGRIHEEDHFWFRRRRFFNVKPHCKAMEANDPSTPTRGRAVFDSRVMIDPIYVKLHITMLHTKYRSFGYCGFREKKYAFPIISL